MTGKTKKTKKDRTKSIEKQISEWESQCPQGGFNKSRKNKKGNDIDPRLMAFG